MISLRSRALTVAIFAALGAASAYARAAASLPVRYTRSVARGLAAASLVATTMLTYRFGVFSPAPVLTTLAVAFFALGEDRIVAYGFTALSGLAYAALAALAVAEGLPGSGLVRPLDAGFGGRLAIVAIVLLVHAATLWHARISRRATLNAIQRSNDWFREARQREVRLDEANRDIDKLLKMNAGDSPVHAGARAGPTYCSDRIGRGAMGEVYAATHAESGESAAVKLLHRDMQEDTLLVQRFLREGEATSKLHAPNVVRIYEVGEARGRRPLSGDGAACAVTTSPGTCASARPAVARRGRYRSSSRWPRGSRQRASRASCTAISSRRTSSSRSRRTRRRIWKILDFGVSRLDRLGGTLTKDVIVGTPGYMSPEQAGGAVTTHRSDIFSFGAVVYRALTGEPPFAAEDTPQTLYQVVYRNPIRPSTARARASARRRSRARDRARKGPGRTASTSALDFAAAMRLAAKNALDPQSRLHARDAARGAAVGGRGEGQRGGGIRRTSYHCPTWSRSRLNAVHSRAELNTRLGYDDTLAQYDDSPLGDDDALAQYDDSLRLGTTIPERDIGQIGSGTLVTRAATLRRRWRVAGIGSGKLAKPPSTRRFRSRPASFPSSPTGHPRTEATHRPERHPPCAELRRDGIGARLAERGLFSSRRHSLREAEKQDLPPGEVTVREERRDARQIAEGPRIELLARRVEAEVDREPTRGRDSPLQLRRAARTSPRRSHRTPGEG